MWPYRLETYAAMREVPNVVIVVGSGFGDAIDSWPYLNGSWSLKHGRPAMPVDAVLVGPSAYK